MDLPKEYPKEWDDLINEKVPKSKIDEYLLRFVARLLREVKAGKREDIDLGDGFSMGKFAMAKESGYKLNPAVYGFLFRLNDYHMEDVMGHGDSEYGAIFETPKEVEKELKRIAKKLGIEIDTC